MSSNGFGKMLGRGFGRLMSQVEKPEKLLDTLEKTMVRGADVIKSAVDDPKGTADAVARHSKAMAEAFKEGYAETTGHGPKGQPDASAAFAESGEARNADTPTTSDEKTGDRAKSDLP